jgi:hypothetical protein
MGRGGGESASQKMARSCLPTSTTSFFKALTTEGAIYLKSLGDFCVMIYQKLFTVLRIDMHTDYLLLQGISVLVYTDFPGLHAVVRYGVLGETCAKKGRC